MFLSMPVIQWHTHIIPFLLYGIYNVFCITSRIIQQQAPMLLCKDMSDLTLGVRKFHSQLVVSPTQMISSYAPECPSLPNTDLRNNCWSICYSKCELPDSCASVLPLSLPFACKSSKDGKEERLQIFQLICECHLYICCFSMMHNLENNLVHFIIRSRNDIAWFTVTEVCTIWNTKMT